MRFEAREKPKPSQFHTSFREPDAGIEDEDQDDNGDGDSDDTDTDSQTGPAVIANDDFEAFVAGVLETFTEEDAAVLAYVEEGLHAAA